MFLNRTIGPCSLGLGYTLLDILHGQLSGTYGIPLKSLVGLLTPTYSTWPQGVSGTVKKREWSLKPWNC